MKSCDNPKCVERERKLTEFLLALGGMAWNMRTKLRVIEGIGVILYPRERRAFDSILADLALLEPEIRQWQESPEGRAAMAAATST